MKFFRLIYAILREIFDESAYERFCARQGVSVAPASYSGFLREREQSKNVKCC
jgi:hypothetical protein